MICFAECWLRLLIVLTILMTVILVFLKSASRIFNYWSHLKTLVQPPLGYLKLAFKRSTLIVSVINLNKTKFKEAKFVNYFRNYETLMIFHLVAIEREIEIWSLFLLLKEQCGFLYIHKVLWKSKWGKECSKKLMLSFWRILFEISCFYRNNKMSHINKKYKGRLCLVMFWTAEGDTS